MKKRNWHITQDEARRVQSTEFQLSYCFHMSAGATTLNAVGSDLAFSISFTIAADLRRTAEETGVSEYELVTLMLLLSITFTTLPVLGEEIVSRASFFCTGVGAQHMHALFGFLDLLVSIARRIALSLMIQLVANAAIAQPVSRVARVLSLLSVATFFLFLQGSASTVQTVKN